MEHNLETKIHGNSGLVNTGNTCYLNVAIQMCSHTYSLASYLLNNVEQVKNILRNNAKSIIKNQTMYLNKMHKNLCKKIINEDFDFKSLSDEEQNAYYNTTVTFQLLKLIKLIWTDNCQIVAISFKTLFVTIRNEYFASNQQHDAEEAYTCIMQTIQEELFQKKTIQFTTKNDNILIFLKYKKDFNNKINSEVCDKVKNKLIDDFKKIEQQYKNESLIIESYKEIKSYYTKSYSKITQMITGFQHSSINCPNIICNFKSSKFEPFQHLSIQIPNSSRLTAFGYSNKENTDITLYSCLDEYFKNEQLDLENAWKCDGCQNKVMAVKNLEISLLPLNLVIQFKRFNNNSSTKNKTMITYPLNDLDMTPYVGSAFRNEHSTLSYMLINVVVHVGNVNAGHYVAYCKNMSNRQWYMFNDDSVTRIDESLVISRDAYLLTYMLINK